MTYARAGSGTAKTPELAPAIPASAASSRSSGGNDRRGVTSPTVPMVRGCSFWLVAGVDLVHRRLGTAAEDHLHSVGGDLHGDGQRLAIGLRRAAEDVICPLTFAGRLVDADADAHEVVRVQVGLDRLETVVTRGAAADLDPHPSDGKVELVVDDHEAVQIVDSVAANQAGDRFAGEIDVGLRKGQRQQLAVDANLGRQGALLGLLEAATVSLCEQRDSVGAEVVTRACVFLARISEPDSE
jgi:hypothetical protein